MYLLTTINLQECGWEIAAIGNKKECEVALEKIRHAIWHDQDGNKMPFSDIYADTRYKNAEIVTNKIAAKMMGGKRNLELATDYYYENCFS